MNASHLPTDLPDPLPWLLDAGIDVIPCQPNHKRPLYPDWQTRPAAEQLAQVLASIASLTETPALQPAAATPMLADILPTLDGSQHDDTNNDPPSTHHIQTGTLLAKPSIDSEPDQQQPAQPEIAETDTTTVPDPDEAIPTSEGIPSAFTESTENIFLTACKLTPKMMATLHNKRALSRYSGP